MAQQTSRYSNDAPGDTLGVQTARRPRVAGPTMPSAGDWTVHEEEQKELDSRQRNYVRKRDREEDRERVDDLVGPREIGRDGALEKKRLKREADRQIRDKEDVGLELGDDALYGGGDSFQRRYAAFLPRPQYLPDDGLASGSLRGMPVDDASKRKNKRIGWNPRMVRIVCPKCGRRKGPQWHIFRL